MLLKPRVFLHVLYNRGSPPLDARGVVVTSSYSLKEEGYDRSARLWADLLRLGAATLAAEVAVRLVTSTTTLPPLSLVGQTTLRAALELAAQLATSTILAMAILRVRGWYPPPPQPAPEKGNSRLRPPEMRDGRRDGFLPILVPLVLLYTALLPLVLRLLLRIWYAPFPSTYYHPLSLPPGFKMVEHYAPALAAEARALTEAWGTTDRVWAGTRLLGGMSAGFGLRVLLPTRPWETVSIVLAGWTAALSASRLCDLAGV